MNKKNFVLKLLKNPTVRRTLINLLKNRRVRSMIFKQIERRIRHRQIRVRGPEEARTNTY